MKTVYSYVNIADEVCYTSETGRLLVLRADADNFELRTADRLPELHHKYPRFPVQPGARYVADLTGPDTEAFVHLLLSESVD